jgi:hypothetical protein
LKSGVAISVIGIGLAVVGCGGSRRTRPEQPHLTPVASCISQWNGWVSTAAQNTPPGEIPTALLSIEDMLPEDPASAYVATMPPGQSALAYIGPAGTCMIFWTGNPYGPAVLAEDSDGGWTDIDQVPPTNSFLQAAVNDCSKSSPNAIFNRTSFTLTPYGGT